MPLKLKKNEIDGLEEFFWNEVNQGRLPGASVVIGNKSSILFQKTYGYKDHSKKELLQSDAIFRLTSLTKIIATLTALKLVEQGKLRLSDYLETYIPEFKNMMVRTKDPKVLIRANKKITIGHLLRHTAGFSYGHLGVEDQKAYKKAGLYMSLNTDINLTNKSASIHLSKIPLNFHPGDRWVYSRAMDIFGYVAEIITGLSYKDIVQRTVLDQLEMKDTGYKVLKKNQNRIAEAMIDESTGHYPDIMNPLEDRKYFCAAEGMVTTLSDFSNLCKMMLNKGKFKQKAFLSPKTIEFMTSNQIGELHKDYNYGISKNLDYGLGVYVRRSIGGSPTPGSVDEFGWWGGLGQIVWVDPREQFYCILMMQKIDEERYYAETLRNFVYRSIQ